MAAGPSVRGPDAANSNDDAEDCQIGDYIAEPGDEVIAGALLVAVHAEDAFAKAGCELGTVPVWVFHGARDSIVPVMVVEDRVDELEACDPPPEELQLTVYPDVDHNAWSRAYNRSAGDVVFAWLLDHTRG